MRLLADVLIITCNEIEGRAVLDVFSGGSMRAATVVNCGDQAFHDLGLVNGLRTAMVQSEMGSIGLGASLQTVQEAVATIQPGAVVMMGVAFGAHPETQKIGQILVSRQVAVYEPQRVGTVNGSAVITARGPKVDASANLLSHFRASNMHWDPTHAEVTFGLILSGEKLIDNSEFLAHLLHLEPETIGGEMEGAGLYVACQRAKRDWILAKAICDWADGNKRINKSENQKLAATNAAKFILHALNTGSLEVRSGPSKSIGHRVSGSSTSAATVSIMINKPLDDFGLEEQSALITTVARLTHVPKDEIHMIQIVDGSSKVTVEMPESAARTLETLWKARHRELGALHITHLTMTLASSEEVVSENDQENAPPEFEVGQMVGLRADPQTTGAVIQIVLGSPENRFVVFHGRATATYYASQLVAITPSVATGEICGVGAFHAQLTALQLRHPTLSALYSLNASRVDFIPYQFRPVLKFVRSDRPRLLIADEVGVGKTIEAGLILREMQARTDLRSVLIICPKPLVTERKWEIEMRRFDERFLPLNGPTLRYCLRETQLDGVWPEQYCKAILPFSLFNEQLVFGRSGKQRPQHGSGLLDLDPPPKFDLVIVDEAHHLKNTDTFVHQGVRFFSENAEAAVFLTATPVQLGSEDLFVLLNLLRPDLVIDRESFEHMASPNSHIYQAVELARYGMEGWERAAGQALDRAAMTPWGRSILNGDPDFDRLRNLMHGPALSKEQRVSCVRELEQKNSFSGLINRTRRRDIGAFTTRKPETVTVGFTPQQKRLHDDLLATQARILQLLHGDANVKFMMSTIRRQAASCLYGLAPFLRDILNRRIDELELDEADEGAQPIDSELLPRIEDQIKEVIAQADNLDPHDPKLGALVEIIGTKEATSNNKVLLFSSFRHTLHYIDANLRRNGIRLGLIHGDTPELDRQELRRRFSLPRENALAVDVLLSSEVGCEGLDYQFCDCLVNYDLPWNPMRIEQRIGRIDRYGQRSEAVAIYNLITPGTIDADIYERCLLRIGVFRQSLGGSEEILGRITRELRSVAENLSLSDDERRARLQQLADNEIRLLQEQAALEEQQAELFGIGFPPGQAQEEIDNASSFWLSPWALKNLIERYLQQRLGDEQQYVLGEKSLRTLRLGQEARLKLIEDFRGLPKQTSFIHREWEAWLKGNEYLLPITFDGPTAAERRDVTLITPVHPLAQQAAQTTEAPHPFRTAFRVKGPLVAGEYAFAIYKWEKRGVRDDVILQPVCATPELTKNFFELLQQAEPPDELNRVKISEEVVFSELDSHHQRLWAEARAEHELRTEQLVKRRRESLETSHKARINILKEQLSVATEKNIRRMRESQLANAEADYLRRTAELDVALSRADIIANPVAFGVIVVEETL